TLSLHDALPISIFQREAYRYRTIIQTLKFVTFDANALVPLMSAEPPCQSCAYGGLLFAAQDIGGALSV
ncbi:hypothetical protein, partial [uncultured Stutzerimonas sp.]|uniref:hypothetical protein n=1 Tax=uncultured Stutzerimonas sp. TaxID=2901168 RepID=UPI0032B21C86